MFLSFLIFAYLDMIAIVLDTTATVLDMTAIVLDMTAIVLDINQEATYADRTMWPFLIRRHIMDLIQGQCVCRMLVSIPIYICQLYGISTEFPNLLLRFINWTSDQTNSRDPLIFLLKNNKCELRIPKVTML